MQAVVVQEGKTAAVVQVPKPVPKEGEILVKVAAAAHNPTDWKHVKYISPPNVISGCDFAGTVEAVGPKVTDVKIGQRVGGLQHGGLFKDQGAFAEYVTVPADTVFTVPDHMSFAEASTFGVGSGTAAAVLYNLLKLPIEPVKENRPKVLIWGASSSVGQFAVQFAKYSNFRVVTTSSPHSFDLLKKYGAEATFDYRDPEVISKIRKWADNDLVYGLDCISEASTIPLATQALTGGNLILLLGPPEDKTGLNPSVTLQQVLLYTYFGKEFAWGPRKFPAVPEHRVFLTKWAKLVTELSAKHHLVGNKATVIGNLGDFQIAFDRLEKGQVKAEKLVMIVDSHQR
ncbi:GroES-like protein, partial [Gorgonomyces haynaldii]